METEIHIVDCLDSLPKVKYNSQLLGATVYPNQQTMFFYSGVFSQWTECSFECSLLGITVSCAEQAMMLYKAHFFKDKEIFDQILHANHPREQKRLGRLVRNFNPEQWDSVKFGAVCSINYDKFNQNKGWKELLLLSHPYQLVEASPTDRIWGIGKDVESPDLWITEQWGQNLLGKALVNVRNKIINKLE